MNLLDSARVASALRASGHEQVDNEADADLIVVNSCTVTAESDKKSRQAAKSSGREGKRVVVMGCGPRVDSKRWQLSLPHAAIIGNEAELNLALGVAVASVDLPIAPRSRLPIAVQFGCDNACAFCITRIARGPHRSVDLGTLLTNVTEAASLGTHEVVLTGINLAAWGCTSTRHPNTSRLHVLLRSLLENTPIHRIRLSSLGPEYLDEAFFKVFQHTRICDHLHLSVQSGSAKVLRRMNRGHGVQQVRWIAERARKVRANVALTADFIVGLPGESDRDHEQTLNLVKSIGFAQLHVFPFSARMGTPAANMPDQVPAQIKKRRSAELRALAAELRRKFLSTQYGRPLEVLVDGDGTAMSSNYIRARVTDGTPKGQLTSVVLTEANVAEVR